MGRLFYVYQHKNGFYYTGPYNSRIIADAVSALFDRIGPGILVPHSNGGSPGSHAQYCRNPVCRGDTPEGIPETDPDSHNHLFKIMDRVYRKKTAGAGLKMARLKLIKIGGFSPCFLNN